MEGHKDRFVLSSDLRRTPCRDSRRGTDADAKCCVYGLVRVHRWMGDEIFHRAIVEGPAVTDAYN